MPRCAATSVKTGKKCKHNAKDGEIYCTSHIKINTPRIPSPMIVEENNDTEGDPSFMLQLPMSSVHIESPTKSVVCPPKHTVEIAHPHELAYLRSLNATYVEIIAKLTRALKEKNGGGKAKKPRVRKMDDKTVDKVAKQMYYKDHKRTPSIIAEIKTRFDQGGMGEVTKVPWQLVKHVTDKFYDALPPQDRDMYIALAKQTLTVIAA
jgi:hypothetical protein